MPPSFAAEYNILKGKRDALPAQTLCHGLSGHNGGIRSGRYRAVGPGQLQNAAFGDDRQKLHADGVDAGVRAVGKGKVDDAELPAERDGGLCHVLRQDVKAAALSADCPVINAGDSGHLHPTQTLTDLLTLQCEKGRLDHLTIGLCGDLINGRTVHSLLKAMSCFEGNHFILISTPELGLPSYVKDILNASNCDFEEVSSLEEVLPKLDVLYMTRIQQERFASREEYLAQKDTYILTTKKMQAAKKDLIVLHPLPRVDEIEVALDDDPRAMYFKQAKYGMYVRMALIITMLNLDTHTTLLRGKTFPGAVCKNPNCITHTETYLPKSFISLGNSLLECEFCNERLLMEH